MWRRHCGLALLLVLAVGLLHGDAGSDLNQQSVGANDQRRRTFTDPELQLVKHPQTAVQAMYSSFAEAQQKGLQGKNQIYKSTVTPHWFANNTRFWYKNTLRGGAKEFILVDAEKGTRDLAFDHSKLAAGLSKAAGADYRADRLPFDLIEFVDNSKAVRFAVTNQPWQCDLTSYECTKAAKGPKAEPTPAEEATAAEDDAVPEEPPPALDGEQFDEPLATQQKGQKGKGVPKKGALPGGGREAKSPDGKWTAVIKDNNVILKDKDGQETILTKDGVEKNAYGNLQWSPDGKSLAFYRTEPGDNKTVQRIETCPKDGSLRTILHTQNYPQPGDKFESHELYVYNAETKETIKADLDKIDFKYRLPPRGQWRKDGRHFIFERTDRGYQRYRIIEVDAHTGKTRNIYDEKTEMSFIDHYGNKAFFIRYLGEDEIILTSEMDGWRHLYLIDAKAGKIKNQITKGQWVVRPEANSITVDTAKRQIWFKASGKNPGQDPYFLHHYRVNFDGTGLVDLTESNGNHTITYSPDNKYILDSYSRPDMPPATELRRVSDGKLVVALEKADMSELEATGWRAPEVFSAKGRDGQTDIWGVVYRPRKLDPNKQYPVIEYIYAGPHDSHVPKNFSTTSQLSALAELGFIVVQIDGMGTANRSRAFHDVCWKNLADAGFPDRILWIKALAKKHAYMDISKVGIYGTSAGGQNALGALLFHGDFYKAAVAACGCHDNRIDKESWNEQWMGLMGPHYKAQSNVTNAYKLKGKVLLIVGELDTNVPPESTYQVVNALIKANKTFDFLAVPGMGHSNGGAYGTARLRDFFVRHLQGVEPPDRNKQ